MNKSLFKTTTAPGPNSAGTSSAGIANRQLLLLASVITVALFFLPDPYGTYLLWPLRLFVTMIHESGHAIAAVVSSGSVNYLQIHPDGSGVTWTLAPESMYWLVFSGGYLGTTIFGAGLLQVLRFSGHKTTLRLIGGYLLAVTLLWAHNPFNNLFTLLAGLILAAMCFVSAQYLSAKAAAFMVAFLAVQCCLNALDDIRTLLYLTTAAPGQDNDALFMSQHYPFPPTFWAVLWAACSVAILAVSLWYYMKATGRRAIAAA